MPNCTQARLSPLSQRAWNPMISASRADWPAAGTEDRGVLIMTPATAEVINSARERIEAFLFAGSVPLRQHSPARVPCHDARYYRRKTTARCGLAQRGGCEGQPDGTLLASHRDADERHPAKATPAGH